MPETRHTNDPVSGERVTIRNDLVRRLRGEYAVGPTLPNGEPEFGWRKFGEPAPVQLEAATEITILRDCLRALANSCDAVGVKHFDTDDMSDEVTSMQQVTQAARIILNTTEQN